MTGAKGSIVIRIVDLCPECKAGHLDLSREAFALIDELYKGRVPITWQVVSPELNEPIAYHFKDGTTSGGRRSRSQSPQPDASWSFSTVRSGCPCRGLPTTISYKPTRGWGRGLTAFG